MTIPVKFVELADLNINTSKPLAFDTETAGFYGIVALAQFYQEDWDHVALVQQPNFIELITTLTPCHIIMQNSHYDLSTIQYHTSSRWIPDRFDDTLLLSRLYFPYLQSFDFETLVTKVLGHNPYKKLGLDKKAMQKSNWAGKLSADQVQYAACDVFYMLDLYNIVKQSEDDMSYKLDMLTLRYCLDFQWNGMPIDQDRVYSKIMQNNKMIDILSPPINVNSWQQVRPYIGEDESDALALTTFMLNGNKKAKQVLRTRKLIKQNSFLRKYENNGERAYGLFKPSARSGRLTSNGIESNDHNQQQHPRSCKDVFGFQPGKGKVLVYSDFAQLELRTIAAITSCTKMAQLFYDGVDVHGFTAEMLFGENWTKDDRQMTKTYNFNLLYGGGVGMILSILILQAEILADERKVTRDKRKWQNLWPEIYGWQEAGISSWRKGRPKQTPLGRKYVGNMMTDHLNIENQGAGAEVSKFALHYMLQRIKDQSIDAVLCNFIHDSYIFECDDNPDVYIPLANAIADSMKEAWHEMSKLFKIHDLPMPVEVGVGYNLGDIENGKTIWSLTK